MMLNEVDEEKLRRWKKIYEMKTFKIKEKRENILEKLKQNSNII